MFFFPGLIPFTSRWVNKKHLHEHELQLSDYNMWNSFAQMNVFLIIIYIFFSFTMKNL